MPFSVQVLNGIFEDLGWQGHVQMQREFMSEAWYGTFRPLPGMYANEIILIKFLLVFKSFAALYEDKISTSFERCRVTTPTALLLQ
jgi:hypothetical protein